MPYYRRAARSYGRRRRAKTLSSYRIATRTSARSQARQIYALNRRITGIQRRTRPETNIMHAPSVNWNTTGSSAASVSYIACYRPFSEGFTIDGNFARLLDATFYVTFQGTLSSTAPYFKPTTLRLVAVQTKATRAEPIHFNDVFYGVDIDSNTNQFVTNSDALGYLTSPFADGLARVGKVLYDRQWTINADNPLKVTKFKLRRILNYFKTENDVIAKGDISLFAIVCSPATGSNSWTVQLSSKIAYTDA